MGKLNCIIIDCADTKRASAFWGRGAGGIRGGRAAMGDLDEVRVGPADLLRVVPEGKAVKNRLHLNIRAADRQAEVQRLVGLGATEIEEMSPVEGYVWTNMKDVEGNEFCVSQA